MLRKAVSDYDDKKSLFPDEKFGGTGDNFKIVLYAFFTKRSEAIGLDIIEGLQKLQEKTGKDFGFELNHVFTREGGQRLTKTNALGIVKEVNGKSKVKRLYVCGPPPQNIMFNELKKQIRGITDLSALDYYVL